MRFHNNLLVAFPNIPTQIHSTSKPLSKASDLMTMPAIWRRSGATLYCKGCYFVKQTRCAFYLGNPTSVTETRPKLSDSVALEVQISHIDPLPCLSRISALSSAKSIGVLSRRSYFYLFFVLVVLEFDRANSFLGLACLEPWVFRHS